MKTIDLNIYNDRYVEFKIGDKIIRCPELSYANMKKITEYENNDNATRKDESEIILWLLNRNTSGVKFAQGDIDKLPSGAITRIYQECVMLSRRALSDPN